MRQVLKIHRDSRCEAAIRIEADVTRPRSSSLAVHFLVLGEIGNLWLPAAGALERADELWRRTCFEVFARSESGASYYEFNFAPTSQWAAYRFGGYRSGVTIAAEVGAPKLEAESNDSGYELRVALELDRLEDLAAAATWELNLSAVIEETGGRKSYWALTHPPGQADFHHPDCFALKLPAA